MGGNLWFEEYKPCLAMVTAQCIYALLTLLSKSAFNQGFSPFVFVVYRQGIATLILIPVTVLAKAKRGRINEMALGLTGFSLVFIASLTGATINQSLNYKGLQLGSSTMAVAMGNLIPAITFVMAASIGLEKVKIRSMRSWAKIIGTIICVGGAMTMALYKGPRVLNLYQNLCVILHSITDKWVLGGLCLMAGSCCWSFWLILQVPICKSYTDPLSLSAWMCLLSTFQSAVVTFFLEPNLSTWKITTLSQLFACLFAGVFGSGVTFYLQSWCITVRGPLYSAMFNPLSTVIATALASLLLHEELHIGSLVGAVAIIGGLYIVLWGKGEDLKSKGEETMSQCNNQENITISTDSLSDHGEDTIVQPLLADKA